MGSYGPRRYSTERRELARRRYRLRKRAAAHSFGDGQLFKNAKAVSDFVGMLIRIGVSAAIASVMWRQAITFGDDLANYKMFVSVLFWLLTAYLSCQVVLVVVDQANFLIVSRLWFLRPGTVENVSAVLFGVIAVAAIVLVIVIVINSVSHLSA